MSLPPPYVKSWYFFSLSFLSFFIFILFLSIFSDSLIAAEEAVRFGTELAEIIDFLFFNLQFPKSSLDDMNKLVNV